MTLHVHHLWGCAPTPLAHYLKALGVLRLVAQQKDPDAMGWWQDEHFCLLTCLDREALERFFLDEYAPTPFVSPWNKGSGFVKVHDPALAVIEGSTAARFAAFRKGIADARAPLAELAQADAAVRALKERTKRRAGMSPARVKAAQALRDDPGFRKSLSDANAKFKRLKDEIFLPCLRTWRGPHRDWLDAAMVWLDEGRPAWPSLLGTGGNDGNLDFTNNAMQRLSDLFEIDSALGSPRTDAAPLLSLALWQEPHPGVRTGAATGQFLPSSAGGANSSSGPTGDSAVNPWDFILMMEGAVLLRARSTRRLDQVATSRAAAPFALRPFGAGHATKGSENAARGEQWMPLWPRPTSLPELETVLSEGRLQLGRVVAGDAIESARALCRLGATRGVDAFTRYAYLERNGRSTFAVPVGRIRVRACARARLTDDLAKWLATLHRLAARDGAPHRLVAAEGRLADAVFGVLTHDDTPERWQGALICAVEIEDIQVGGTAVRAGPIPRLSGGWLEATADGTPEWRLARALGSAGAGQARWGPIDTLRHHWLPLDRSGRSFQANKERLLNDPRVVATGRDPVRDLAAIVERRLVEAAQRGERCIPILARFGCGAHPSDLAALLAGQVDLFRTCALARAFMALRWPGAVPAFPPVGSGAWPPEPWLALRLMGLPWALSGDRPIPAEPAAVRRLTAGDAASAVDCALRRLRSAGIRVPVAGGYTDPETAVIWAAALAFPVERGTSHALLRRFEPVTKRNAHES